MSLPPHNDFPLLRVLRAAWTRVPRFFSASLRRWSSPGTRKGGSSNHRALPRVRVTPTAPAPARKAVERQSPALLHDSSPMTESGPVAHYLAHIGFACLSGDLPRLRERPAARGGPSLMIAELVDVSGHLRGFQYTYLAAAGNGYAVIENRRELKRLRPEDAFAGTAIRLYEAQTKVAVAESIELALAARVQSKWPVWATASPALLAALELPLEIRDVRIYAAGPQSAAARELRGRLKARRRNIEIIVIEPLSASNSLAPSIGSAP